MKSEELKIYLIYFVLLAIVLTIGMLTNVC